VNLAQIRSAVPEIFDSQTNKKSETSPKSAENQNSSLRACDKNTHAAARV